MLGYNFQGFSTHLRRVIEGKNFVFVVLLCALVIRLMWVLFVDSIPVSDSQWYFERALAIARGEGYSVNGRHTAFWPVGYPGYLGILFKLLGPSLLIAKVSNVILGIAGIFISYLICKKIFSSEIVARIAVVLIAIHPNALAYTSLLLSEQTHFTIFAAAVLIHLSIRDGAKWGVVLMLLAGVLYGVGTLIKPQTLFFPVIVEVAVFLWERNWKSLKGSFIVLLVLITMQILTLLPWSLRNYAVFGKFVLVSNNGGVNLVIGNNPKARGNYSGIDYYNRNIQTGSELEDDENAEKFAIHYVLTHPWETLKILPRKFFYLYYEDSDGFRWNEKGMVRDAEMKGYDFKQDAFYEEFLRNPLRRLKVVFTSDPLKAFFVLCILVSCLYYYPMMLIFISFILLQFIKDKGRMLLLSRQNVAFFIIVGFTGLYMPFFGISRFHFAMMPFVAMFAASFICTSVFSRRLYFSPI